MQRCIACNTILYDTEIKQIKDNGEPEDMCNRCRGHAYSDYDYASDHDHIHGSLEEGLSFPLFYKE